MTIVGHTEGLATRRLGERRLVPVLCCILLLAVCPRTLGAQQAPQASQQQPQDQPAQSQAASAPPYAQQSPSQLQRLVAPIALYPDSLVAQILAAATFPEQVVEADRWVQANPDLKGDALGKAVDQQPWDPSVKALTAFPSVLGNMDKNLSWASSLGDAYFNQQPDVMDAVQVMRRRAQAAGDLKTTSQQNVTTQDETISVQPSDPEIVYVPAYNPWLAYGDPILAWPGWYPYPGIWFGGPYLSWGEGFGIGWFGGYGWGWNHWGFNWGGRYAMYGGGRYYSRSNTFYNRSNFYRAGSARSENGMRGAPGNRSYAGNRSANGSVGARGEAGNRPGPTARPFDGNSGAARGYGAPRGQSGVRSGAFSGYDHGGQARNYSSRGSASMGAARAGGGFRGGGGGSHGGGGHGGGGHGGGGRH
jgi:hypothetical protein